VGALFIIAVMQSPHAGESAGFSIDGFAPRNSGYFRDCYALERGARKDGQFASIVADRSSSVVACVGSL
jgi:hypothetical protein